MSWRNLHRITEKELNEIAVFGDTPKTEHWHLELGKVMFSVLCFTPAMKHLQAALDINPSMWMPMVLLGRCLGPLGRFEEALSWMNKAIKSLPQGRQSVAENILKFVAEYKEKLGDSDGAIAASEERLRSNPSGIATVSDYIKTLYRAQRYETVLDLTRDIDRREASNFARSLLVELISCGQDIGDAIGESATVVGGAAGSEVRELVRKAIDDAVVVADKAEVGQRSVK
jgi:tetratricopeptide (TPR) repeat protein